MRAALLIALGGLVLAGCLSRSSAGVVVCDAEDRAERRALQVRVLGAGLQSQGHWVRGRVLDGETGQQLPGVTVWVVGTERGAATDPGGLFRLDGLSPRDTLQVSYVFYQTQRVTVAELTRRAN